MGHEELILIVIQRTIKLLAQTKLLCLKQNIIRVLYSFFLLILLIQGGGKMEE